MDLKVPLGDSIGCVSVCRLPEEAIKNILSTGLQQGCS